MIAVICQEGIKLIEDTEANRSLINAYLKEFGTRATKGVTPKDYSYEDFKMGGLPDEVKEFNKLNWPATSQLEELLDNIQHHDNQLIECTRAVRFQNEW